MSVKVNPFYGCKWYEVICNGWVDWPCKWYQWYLVLRTSKNFLSANKLSRRNLNWTIVHCSPPPSPLFRTKNAEWELASLFYVYFWEGSDFHLRFTIIFYGIFTVFRSPRWFSPFKKIVWYTNRSVISITQWTKLTCVYQTNMCLYSRMRYANQQHKQWHKHKHKTR